MKFYARKHELELLDKQYQQTNKSSAMTVITGKRRMGKTLLVKKYAEDKKTLYFFISKKNEALLCQEFTEIIQNSFDYPVPGEIRDFKNIFKLIMEIGKKERCVVIVDEFQEFCNINPSVYSEVRNIWDEYKKESKVHLIFIGSTYSLMQKIFKKKKEPLFGRTDRTIHLNPFSPHVLKEILEDNGRYDNENLFMNYLITGGVPRYQEILVRNQVFTQGEIIDFYFEENSPIIEEGGTILMEEFGREYGTYFSILGLMSEGRTSRSEMESILGKNIGGYLEKLETDYDIVGKIKPFGAKPTGRIQKYFIKDNFLKFWFRYAYKYRSAIESNNYKYIKKKLQESLRTYSRPVLERLYLEIFRLSGDYSETGSYWERGGRNEIDLICIDELNEKILLGEVKMNEKKINIEALKAKAKKVTKKYEDYEIEYVGLGLNTLDEYL